MASRGGEEAENSVTTVIEFITDDEKKLDLAVSLELADRINSNKAECREAVQAITKTLGNSNSAIVKKTIELLETLVKNCNQRFQYELSNKKFVEAMLKLLKKKRKKSGFFGKIFSDNDENLPFIENKILYLIQLWADTFMMHEDEFKTIIECYRLLRKEGIQFPARDVNEKFMINFNGQVSPIFLVMENNNAPEDSKPTKKKKEQAPPKPPAEKKEVIDDEIYFAAHEGSEISQDEIQILKGSMSVLKEIADNSTEPGDLKTEIAKEILGDLVEVQKKLTRIIKVEKMTKSNQRRVIYELDYEINECIASYKSRYSYLKDNAKKGIKSTPLTYAIDPRESSSAKDVLPSKEEKKTKDNATKEANTKTSSSAKDKKVQPSSSKQPTTSAFEESKTTKPTIVSKEAYSGASQIKKFISPPPGWKQPATTTTNMGNLLDTFEVASPDTTTKEKPKFNIDDLLDLNFGGGAPVQQILTPETSHPKSQEIQQIQMQPPITNTQSPPQNQNDFNFDFGKVQAVTRKNEDFMFDDKKEINQSQNSTASHSNQTGKVVKRENEIDDLFPDSPQKTAPAQAANNVTGMQFQKVERTHEIDDMFDGDSKKPKSVAQATQEKSTNQVQSNQKNDLDDLFGSPSTIVTVQKPNESALSPTETTQKKAFKLAPPPGNAQKIQPPPKSTNNSKPSTANIDDLL